MKARTIIPIIAYSVILFIGMVTTSLAESSRPMGMVTGSSSGTYIQFGQQIKEIGLGVGVDIEVKTSGGSLENIKRIRSKENAALGIVQSDVLSFIQNKSGDKGLQKFVRNLRLIYPFYNEEVHLYARKEINSINDLQGKRVAISSKNSGTWLTSLTILDILGIEPSDTVTHLSYEEAASAIVAGNLDAMIYVAGKPVKLFTDLENVKKKEELAPLLAKTHFVPIDQEEVLQKGYVRSEIGPSDYTWCESSVPTVAVKAILISYDFSRKLNEYQEMRCDQLFQLSSAIKRRLATIRSKIDEEKDQKQKTWHPKWKEVNLKQEISLWQLDQCSRGSQSTLEQKILEALKGR